MKTLNDLLSQLRLRGITVWLEGDRLRYRASEGAMTPELMADLKANKTEIIAFLQQASTASHSSRPLLVAIKRNGTAPLSFAQQRFWLLNQFEPNSSVNNMPVVLHLKGQLNIAAWGQSLTELVRRHEILRTTFPVIDGQPRQVIAPSLGIELPIADLRQIPPEQRDDEALRLATEVAQQPFDLAEGPMLHLKLLQLKDDEYLFIWCLHCITGDGSSSDIFYQELTTIYGAFSAGKPSPLPELPIQYADFAHWQREWLQGEVLEAQLEYWKKQLSGTLKAIPLPTDYPRPPVQTYRGDRCPRMFSKQLHGKLMQLAQQSGTTLFMILLAAFETLLYRYSSQEDLLISFTNAGRNQMETENLIGFFSGTLLLRTNFAGNPTFRSILDHIKDEALEAYAHQDLPFEKLLEDLRPEQNQNRSPLFQIKFALNPPWTNGRGMSSVQLPDIQIDSLFGYIYHGKTKFDLILVMREQEQGLGAVFDYNADLFDISTANCMMDRFEMLLEGIIANRDQPILDLPFLKPEERNLILEKWADTQSEYPELSLPQLFEAQAEQTPEAIAVISTEQSLTYRELNQKANQLADYLQNQELPSGNPLALCVEKPINFVVGILGILKTGSAYIPIDQASPIEWQVKQIQDAQVPLILTDEHLLTSCQEYADRVVVLDRYCGDITNLSVDNALTKIDLDRLAAIVCSADPLGNSQGVPLTHRQIVSHSSGISKTFGLNSSDRLLSSSSFISSKILEDLFASWHCGATVIFPYPKVSQMIADLLMSIESEQISVLKISTKFWQTWLENLSTRKQTLPTCLRLIVVTGESVSRSDYDLWRSLVGDAPQWIYTYGLTETMGIATFYDPLKEKDSLRESLNLPIGRPLSNLQTYILDRNLQPFPIGVAGDLYIGGIGLSQSYFNNPDLTTQKMIPNPFSQEPKSRLLKTGKIARYLANGNLELREDKSSPVKAIIGDASRQTFSDAIEDRLAQIWETIFDIHPIGIRDNFFDIGGYSLLAVRLFAEIEKTFAKNLPLSVLLKAPTIEQLAKFLREETETIPWSPLVTIQTGTSSKPPLFCIHGGGFNILIYRDLALNLGSEQTVYGLQARGLDGNSPIRDRLEDIAADYIQQIQTIQPQGPYFLSGLSNGGNIALEMAQQLQKQAQKVALLAMFDTYAPGGAKLLPPLPRLLSSLSYAVAYSVPRLKTKIDKVGTNVLLEEAQTKLKAIRPSKMKKIDRQSDLAPTTVITEQNSSARTLEQRINQVSQYIIDHSPWAFFTPTAQLVEVNSSLSNTMKQLEASYQKLHKAYCPKPYSGKISLFRAMESPPGYVLDRYLGWGAIALEGIEVYKIPGHHTSLMASPILAKKMKNALQKAQHENNCSPKIKN
jgi:non-ribosomal peptide synthetase component F/thioesterase domain-containing protein/acyl carrier protein